MSELKNSFYESDNDSSDEVELNLYDNSDCSELENENDDDVLKNTTRYKIIRF